MIDLRGAARGAVYRALNAGAAGALAQVFTEAPQGSKPPYYELGSITSVDVSAKPGDRRQEITIELWSVYRGEAGGDLLAMMNAAEGDLDHQPITAPGAALRSPRFVSGMASDADSDGITYAGLQHFTIQAQPA